MPDLPLSQSWPYLPILSRIALAVSLGLFLGLERERRHKEAGVRTFAFVAIMGVLAGLLGDAYALLTLGLVSVFVAFLNIYALIYHESLELTTSAALVVTALMGVLCSRGHLLTPVAVAVITAALLAWKETLTGFSLGLTETELRSAILLAILAFVIYPALPVGTIDPWGIIEPRTAWLTVILISGIGFVNYVLWKAYGTKGLQLTGFFGGLVNSSVTVSELASRVREIGPPMISPAYRGIVLATLAMVIRNMVLLAILATAALRAAWVPLLLMLVTSGLALLWREKSSGEPISGEGAVKKLGSPFSLGSAIRFGVLFLALQMVGVLGQDAFGAWGVYAVSLLGGLFSSASAVAAAAALCAKGTVTPLVAGVSAVIASAASAMVNLPFILRSQQKRLIQLNSWAMGAVVGAALLGSILQVFLAQR